MGRFIVTINFAEVLRQSIVETVEVNGLVGSLGEGYGHDESAHTAFRLRCLFCIYKYLKAKGPGEGLLIHPDCLLSG